MLNPASHNDRCSLRLPPALPTRHLPVYTCVVWVTHCSLWERSVSSVPTCTLKRHRSQLLTSHAVSSSCNNYKLRERLVYNTVVHTAYEVGYGAPAAKRVDFLNLHLHLLRGANLSATRQACFKP